MSMKRNYQKKIKRIFFEKMLIIELTSFNSWHIITVTITNLSVRRGLWIIRYLQNFHMAFMQ